MRDILEHADEKIVQGVETGIGLTPDFFTFGDTHVDIGEGSLQLLTSTWERLVSAVMLMPQKPDPD